MYVPPTVDTFVVRGSHGDLAIDRDTGRVLPERSHYDGDDYRDITRFNVQGYLLTHQGTPDDLLTKHGECDILDIGYWYRDEEPDGEGTDTYAPPRAAERTEHWFSD